MRSLNSLTPAEVLDWGLILQPILKPAVNDLPLAASRTEIEKVRLVCL